jgi:nucleoside-diphosphate-sugar epimerase
MSSILVSGGTGAMGSWVVRELIEQGYDVTALDIAPNMALLKGLGGKLEVIKGDITDLAFLLRLIKERRIERIIHTAAILPDEAQRDPVRAFRVNSEGTVNLLEAALLFGVKRFVYTSTGGVLGPTYGEYAHPNYKPMGEDMLKNPQEIYASTKLLGEDYGLNYSRNYGLDFVSIRFPSLYGPMKAKRHASVAWVDRMISQALMGKAIRITKNAYMRRDLTYNRDCARALLLACFGGGLRHRIYHIGTGIGISFEEVAELLKEMIPGARVEVSSEAAEERAAEAYYGVMDITKAKSDFGFTPKYSIETGLRDYLAVMKEYGLEPTNF